MKQIKHIALLLLFALSFSTVSAQIHESKSYIKKTTITKEKKVETNPWKKCQWYGRAGVLIPVAVSEHDDIISPMAGFDLDFGFKLRMGRHGWYWGMDLALFTGGLRGQDYYVRRGSTFEHRDGKSATKVGGRLGLTTFGWRARFSDFILDINAGIALGYTSELIIDNYDAVGYNYHGETGRTGVNDTRFRVEFPVGIGLAYKHFTLDFSLLYSPVMEYEYPLHYYSAAVSNYQHVGLNRLTYNNFRISLGYLF